MQISKNVYAIKTDFQIPLPDGKFLDRFVYCYLINNEKLTLIDSGVRASVPVILAYIKSIGRKVEDISDLILTHAHPDHIGGAKEIRSLCGCVIHAHHADADWIEDVDRQFKCRPVPGFYNLIGGSVSVNNKLSDGDSVINEIKILHTPGHSEGHIALHFMKENILFSADAIPMKGDIPIYSDPKNTSDSILKMKAISGIKILLSSWDSPRYNIEIQQALDSGIDYIRIIHRKVLDELKSSDETISIAKNVWKGLGLPEYAFNPLFVKTIEGHLKRKEELN